MKLLVTGASGFIGRNLLLALPKDWEVIATYRNDESFSEFINRNDLSIVKPLRIDLCDEGLMNSVEKKFKFYDACVYLAANGDPDFSEKAPITDLKKNTLALLNTVQNWTFGKFLYFSSGAVYDGLRGDVSPQSFLAPYLPYAISKLASERYVHHAQRSGKIDNSTVVRFFGAYGPYEAPRKIYGRLVQNFGIDKNSKFTIRGNGQNLIDAMYIDDLIHAVMILLTKTNEEQQTLDLYAGNGVSVESLVRQTASIFKINPDIEFIGEVPEFIEFHSNDKRMNQEFGFSPKISLREGLLKFHSWIEEQSRYAHIRELS